MSFAVGDRVIVTRDWPGHMSCDLIGCYGHVTGFDDDGVLVMLRGRVAAFGEVPEVLRDEPFPFYHEHLDHAD